MFADMYTEAKTQVDPDLDVGTLPPGSYLAAMLYLLRDSERKPGGDIELLHALVACIRVLLAEASHTDEDQDGLTLAVVNDLGKDVLWQTGATGH
jgi:hypothetical protein